MVRTGPKSRNGRNEEEIRYVTSEQQEDKVVGWKKKHLRSGRKKTSETFDFNKPRNRVM